MAARKCLGVIYIRSGEPSSDPVCLLSSTFGSFQCSDTPDDNLHELRKCVWVGKSPNCAVLLLSRAWIWTPCVKFCQISNEEETKLYKNWKSWLIKLYFLSLISLLIHNWTNIHTNIHKLTLISYSNIILLTLCFSAVVCMYVFF